MDQKVRSNSLFKLPQDCSSCWTERDVGQCGSEWNIARTYCSARKMGSAEKGMLCFEKCTTRVIEYTRSKGCWASGRRGNE